MLHYADLDGNNFWQRACVFQLVISHYVYSLHPGPSRHFEDAFLHSDTIFILSLEVSDNVMQRNLFSVQVAIVLSKNGVRENLLYLQNIEVENDNEGLIAPSQAVKLLILR